MDRKAKIEKLKAIMAGKLQPLQDATLFWQQQESGLFQCESLHYGHLLLTKGNLDKFIEQFGGKHVVFESYEDDRDEPIAETSEDNVIRWKEQKTYEPSHTTETVKELKVTEPAIEPEQPKKEKRKRKVKHVPIMVDPKAKEKAAYQKILAEIEADNQKREASLQYNYINREFQS